MNMETVLESVLKAAFLVTAVIFPFLLVFQWFERKFGADLQARVGPSRTGPRGFLQPLADLLKLLHKGPQPFWMMEVDPWLISSLGFFFATLAFLPLGSAFPPLESELGTLIPILLLWAAQISLYFLCILDGTGSSWLEGLRGISQSSSGFFLAVLSLMIPALRAGGFSWSHIFAAQGASPIRWLVFRDPFLFLSFLSFLFSGITLLGIPPLPSREKTFFGLSGFRLWLFRFMKEYGLFFWCATTCSIFLGGSHVPPFLSEAIGQFDMLSLLLKTFLLMTLVSWIARSSPLPRSEHTSALSWKGVAPLAFLSLFGEILWIGGIQWLR